MHLALQKKKKTRTPKNNLYDVNVLFYFLLKVLLLVMDDCFGLEYNKYITLTKV